MLRVLFGSALCWLALGQAAAAQDAIEVDWDEDASVTIEDESQAELVTPDADTAPEAAAAVEVDLGSAEVLGQRSLAAQLGPGHSLEVVDRERLAAAGGLAAALESVAGVEVLRQGGAGQLMSIQVRGARAAQVLVLLDGAPLADGPVDLSLIPPAALERVEILRGPEASRFGPGALGGVVNLVTRQPKPKVDQTSSETPLPLSEHLEELLRSGAHPATGELALTAGSFGLWGVRAAWERDGVLAGFAVAHAANDYTFDRAGGAGSRRENAAAGMQSAWGAWAAQSWTYRATVSRNQRGVPGSAEFPTRLAELEQLGVWLQGAQTGRRWDLSYLDAGFHDPDPYLSGGPIDSSERWWHADYAWGSSGGGAVPWGIRPRVDYLEGSGSGSRRRLGLDAQYQWSRTHGPDTVSAEAGLVVSEGPGADPVGRVGWQRQLGSAALVYSTAAYAVRHPTFEELYLLDTGGVQGNPRLKPERVVSAEIGAFVAGRRAQAELALFYSAYADSILWVPVSAYLVRAENTGRARVAGAELSAEFELGAGWRSSTAYTRLERAELANGLPLAGRARDHLNQRLDYVHGGWRGGLSLDYTSELPADLFGNLRIPARWLTGLRLGRSWDRSSLDLQLDNLFNVSTRDSWNYPLPGRSFEITWRTDL